MSSAVRSNTLVQSTPSPILANLTGSVGHTLVRHCQQVTHQTVSVGYTLDSANRHTVGPTLDIDSRLHTREGQQSYTTQGPQVTYQTGSVRYTLDGVCTLHTSQGQYVTNQTVFVGHTLDSVRRLHTRQNQQSYT